MQPKINLAELQQTAPIFFDSKFYSCIMAAGAILFPKGKVKADVKNGKITIEDKVNILFHCSSGNEDKVYIQNFFCPKDLQSTDHYYQMMKVNSSFRFFNIEQVVNYLYIKRDENDYIRANEG